MLIASSYIFGSLQHHEEFCVLSESVCFTCVSRQWLKSEDIQRISLFFHNKALEKEVGECIQNGSQHCSRGQQINGTV